MTIYVGRSRVFYVPGPLTRVQRRARRRRLMRQLRAARRAS